MMDIDLCLSSSSSSSSDSDEDEFISNVMKGIINTVVIAAYVSLMKSCPTHPRSHLKLSADMKEKCVQARAKVDGLRSFQNEGQTEYIYRMGDEIENESREILRLITSNNQRRRGCLSVIIADSGMLRYVPAYRF